MKRSGPSHKFSDSMKSIIELWFQIPIERVVWGEMQEVADECAKLIELLHVPNV